MTVFWQVVNAAGAIAGWELGRSLRTMVRRRRNYSYTSVDGRTSIEVSGISAESFARLIDTIEKRNPKGGAK